MARIPPISEFRGLRGGDRGGAHNRPIRANTGPDDSVIIGAEDNNAWTKTEYTDSEGRIMWRIDRNK